MNIGGDTVIVKAKKTSKKTFTEATQYMHQLDREGQPTGEVVPGGKFSGERFPQTVQGFRPSWSMTKKQWLIQLEEEELQKLVSRVKFKYERGPDVGRYIASADRYDFDDPFFNHSELLTRFKEGEHTLLKGSPLDELAIAGMKADRTFQNGVVVNPATSIQVKYVISDKENDGKIAKQVRNLEVEAITEFATLSHKRKLAIAGAMGLRVADATDPDLVDSLLYKIIKEDGISDNGKMNREWFIELAKEESDSLELKYQINLAIKQAVIRKSGREGYLLNGEFIGKTIKEVEDYFSDPSRSDALATLMDIVKMKARQ
jgi:hypothetical protein